jgi:HEAT repeat protein
MKRAADRNTLLRVRIAILPLAVTAFVLVALWHSAEPSYQGQSLSRWLDQYHSARGTGTPSVEAEESIRQIGTNALPPLIRMIRARDSSLKETAMKWSSKQQFIKFSFTPASRRRYQAQAGYQVLAAEAKAQVPQLITILTNDSSAQVRQCTASALGFIGEDAKSAAAALLVTAKDQDKQVRNSSLWALSRIHADPELVVPGLIEALDDSFSVARENAAIGLRRYGEVATSAIPALVRTIPVNRAARSALLQIDPKAASPE